MSQLPVCLSIAGSDSSAGAGIQADLKTFASLGCYGTTVITALTAQNTKSVETRFAVPPEVIQAQIQTILKDFSVSAIKIGMVYTRDCIQIIANELKQLSDIPIVLDPVLLSTSGHPLLEVEAIEALKQELFPLAEIITPNIEELMVLTYSLTADPDLVELGKRLMMDWGTPHVLIKGGHSTTQFCEDILVQKQGSPCPETQTFRARKIKTKNTHGTGCTLSSAITAYLALNEPIEAAIDKAKHYVTGAIRSAKNWSLGAGPGPLNHFFQGSYENSD